MRRTVEGSADTLPATPVSGDRGAGASRPGPLSEPDTTQKREAVEERMQSLVGREDLAKYQRRLQHALLVGGAAWLAFGVISVLRVLQGSAPWWLYLAARLIPAAIAAAFLLDLRRRAEVSRRQMQIYETVAFTSAVACSTTMLVADGGWATPRLHEIGLIMLGHGILLGSAWWRSLWPVASMTLAVPITMGAITLLQPSMAAQLSDPEAMSTFANHMVFVLGIGLVSLYAGHSVWKLRGEVAESKSIGRYRLRRRIAAGGMGEVWAAYHAGLRRDVAVKLIQPRLGKDEVAVERFEREVRTLAELTHPNVVRVFDFGATEAGVWYYAMELLRGEDLHTIVTRDGPFDAPRAVRLVTQAAQALAEAHGRGIVHRDVKPANLILVPGAGGEYVKLVDFGIARDEEQAAITRTGIVVGTPGYIAPEVITGGKATARSDVYALGMVLYVLLTGALAYEETLPAALLRAALQPAPPPSCKRPDLPADLDALIQRCLTPDPAARPADGGELVAALQAIAARE